jgi:signal transduction histidine kinase
MKRFFFKYGYEVIIVLLIAGISIVHYLSGYSDAPYHRFYRLLYTIPIIMAAYKYGFKGGVVTSIAVGLVYSPNILLAVGFGSQITDELLDIFFFFSVGACTGILFERKNFELNNMKSSLTRYILLEKYTNSIIESIKSGVVAVNNDMFVTIINQGAKEILDIDENCIGQSFLGMAACCDSVKTKAMEAMEHNRVIENIEIDVKITNKETNIRVNIYPLNLENMNKGLVMIFDDVTELNKLQKHVQRNDKLAALGELSTGIAHEIRNPLAIIKAVAQTMKGEVERNTEAVRELEIIDEEVERANRIVKSLMDFAKPNKNEMTLCAIDTLMEDVITITSKYIKRNEITINYYSEKIPGIVASKELLKQAFINLIFNATDAMPDGGELTIAVKNLNNQWIQIVFQDTGMGIEESNIKKVFNPFFTTKEEGTGLGLSIVHRIVEEHNGVIDVFSKVGEGSRFELLLPINKEVSINS